MIIKKQYKFPIEKIEIQIKDNGKYADMAYFFDRYDVLEDIAKLRKSWIGKKLIPNKELDNLITNIGSLKRTPKERDHFWYHFNQLYKIAQTYDVGYNYLRPIGAAVLCGIITDKDYNTMMVEDIHDYLPAELRLGRQGISISHRIRDIDFVNQHDNKSISTVKRDREWYWMYHQMGYRKIANLANVHVDTVRTAINSYYKRVWSAYSRVV